MPGSESERDCEGARYERESVTAREREGWREEANKRTRESERGRSNLRLTVQRLLLPRLLVGSCLHLGHHWCVGLGRCDAHSPTLSLLLRPAGVFTASISFDVGFLFSLPPGRLPRAHGAEGDLSSSVDSTGAEVADATVTSLMETAAHTTASTHCAAF
jgi:hypothetical protein